MQNIFKPQINYLYLYIIIEEHKTNVHPFIQGIDNLIIVSPSTNVDRVTKLSDKIQNPYYNYPYTGCNNILYNSLSYNSERGVYFSRQKKG